MDNRREIDQELQRQIDALSEVVAAHRAEMDALRTRAEAAEARADSNQVRADANHDRADAMEIRADADHARMDRLEVASAVDREMITELQADGLLSREHAAQMEEALRSSRTIGAAIGIVMASRQKSQDEAFAILKQASRNSNRKLREIADDLVGAAGVSDLPDT